MVETKDMQNFLRLIFDIRARLNSADREELTTWLAEVGLSLVLENGIPSDIEQEMIKKNSMPFLTLKSIVEGDGYFWQNEDYALEIRKIDGVYCLRNTLTAETLAFFQRGELCFVKNRFFNHVPMSMMRPVMELLKDVQNLIDHETIWVEDFF